MSAVRNRVTDPGLYGQSIRIRGLVQGVGFRPTVWRLAREAGLSGSVRNDAEGVLIEAVGSPANLDRFLDRLTAEAPPLARIDAVETAAFTPPPIPKPFEIIESAGGLTATGIVPDAATCPACLSDIADPGNRRHGYAFTNCTHCGPRLSIVTAIPYDRAATSMAAFDLCPDCAAEYRDPADRRFHAQPNACPRCGPKLWLEAVSPECPTDGDPIEAAAGAIRDGFIVAVKGIGGFHLACDATNDAAIARLRARKKRDAKPLAVMVRDLEAARAIAEIGAAEADALQSTAAPIVLVRPRPGALAHDIAPDQDRVGVMLPYSPLHHLLMAAVGRPAVMTSGNLSEEPQVTGNDAARRRLAGIADLAVFHDRGIVNRIDDSVGHVANGRFRLIRRARGYAPEPLPVPPGFGNPPRVLAMGPELKATFTLLTPAGAVVSQHIGDLENPETNTDYRRLLALYCDLFEFDPDIIAVDRHPDYFSTQTGFALAGERGIEPVLIDHHHAHIAALLGEVGRPLEAAPVVGIALDGLGMGPQRALWGGEILIADYRTAEHIDGLPPVPLLGGAKAMKEPWRNLFAHLHRAFGWQEAADRWGALLALQLLSRQQTGPLIQMAERGINSPPASSAGRLFDAVAAALMLHPERVGFEGQAAIALETCARRFDGEAHPYPVSHTAGQIALEPLWRAILDDLAAGRPECEIAARFHASLADHFAARAITAAQARGLDTVALSGGVFQNRLLTGLMARNLARAGLTVLTHATVPANDGGLSLGQALIAAARA